MSAARLEHALDAIGWLKEFAGLRLDGYSTPYVAVHHDSNRLADHTSAGGLLEKYEKESESGGQSVETQYRSQGKSDVGVSKLERGGRITIPSQGIRPHEGSRLGKIIRSYSGGNGTLRSHLGGGSRDVVADPYQVARKALRRHEIVHSLLQQRRGGAPDTVAKLAGEELTAYRKQLFGKKSPAKHLPVSRRISKLVKGTIASTVAGKKNLGITKWFERAGYQASLDKARNRTERNPTEPQKKAGNYRKGSLSFQGIRVTLENPRGSIRRGVDDDGKPWSNEMHADYGYIPRTKGKDGDQVDVFLGPSHRSQLVVAIDQHKGEAFDETKFILGCDTREQAEKLYLAHYPKDWKLGPVSTCTIDQFKQWLSRSHPGRMGHMKQPFHGQDLKALTGHYPGLKAFAGLIPQGYRLPATWEHDEPDLLASYTHPNSVRQSALETAREEKRPLREVFNAASGSLLERSRMRRGGVIDLPSREAQSDATTHSGQDALNYRSPRVAKRAYRRHEVVHSILQQRRGGPPDTVAKLAGEEAIAYAKQLFGKKSPAAHLPLGMRIGKFLRGVPLSTAIGKNNLGISKWFEVHQAALSAARNRTEKNPTSAQIKAGNYRKTKEFAGLIPDGYIRPGVVPETRDNKIATYRSPSSLKADVKDYRENFGGSLKEHYQSLAKTAGTKPKNVARGGIITLAPTSRLASLPGDLGESVRQYGEPALARRALRRHEIVHSILQQRRKGPPDTVAKLAGEEFTAYRKQLFGKKSPASHLPLGTRVRKIIDGTIDSTKRGKKALGISKWFEELTAARMGMKQFEKPFLRYSAKRHARTGGLNDSFRENYNREHGSHLKRPVTTKPSELKPGSKAAKRRESFCARMSGVSGPTSKDGKLTPKGAALKRWNCSALVRGIKLFSQTPEEERNELLKTGLLSTGLAGGLALGGAALRGTVGAAEKVAIKRATASKIAVARRNARVAGEARAAETAKTAKLASKDRYKAGNTSFQNLARNPNLTKGEKATVKRVHGLWKSANPGKEFSSGAREHSGSEKLRDGAIGAGALAAGGGILHAGLKVGRAADEVTPTAKAIRAVLAHGEQAAGNLRKGWLGRVLRLSAKNRSLKRFALKAEEDGVPLTGRTAHDRFVKTVREGDLDRRDRNINRAAGAGAVAGWLTHGKGSTLNQRLGRLGLGAAAGMGGVLAVRAATDKHRDIYGDRPRWAKRAEVLPTVAGVGAAGAILAKKAKLFAAHDREHAGHQVLKAGISGAASGALLGGGTALLTRGKSLKSVLQAAGIGAGAMGALAGGGTAIGNKVLGDADPNDKAAFTKRAAVGGAIAGAALGGVGAVGLKKGLLGSKIADGFAKGAKTWRPLHAIEQSSAPVAAAVGAGAGALYGAHQGADEGMMVDAINNSRVTSTDSDRSKKNLSSKIQGLLKEFDYSSQLREKDTQRYVSPTRAAMVLTDYDGSLGTYQVAKGFYNKGKAAHRWGGRGTNLLRDTGDVLAGRGRRTDQAGRPQKREWEKSWFHRTVGSAAAGGALLGGALLTSKTRLGQQHILPQIKKADAAAQKYGVSLFSIKLNRLKQFDLDAALSGWDVRDPRGRSARVFAPGSRPRFRRQKEWHEKKENREALLKGAIVGTGVLGIAGGVAGGRKLAGLSVIPKMAKAAKSTGYPVINPGEKLGKFANFVPKEHRGGNIIDAPIKFRPYGAA